MKICTIIPFFSNNITSPHLCDSSLGSSVTAPNNNTSLYDTSYKLVLSNRNPTAQARPHYNHRENLSRGLITCCIIAQYLIKKTLFLRLYATLYLCFVFLLYLCARTHAGARARVFCFYRLECINRERPSI